MLKMKSMKMKPLLFCAFFASFLVGCKDPVIVPKDEDGVFQDSRDLHVYKYITLANQVWMAENLAYLPSVFSPTFGDANLTRYYVYGYEGDTTEVARAKSNYATYGVLYNWVAALSACPAGWHLPTDTEFTALTDSLINKGFGFDGSGSDIAKSMASTSGWDSFLIRGTPGNDQALNNESGFSAPPGGYRGGDGKFIYIGNLANYWTASEDGPTTAWSRHLYFGNDGVMRYSFHRSSGFSIRCVRD
jgi:uncharacterized protein (TIGR02145 family)